MSDNQLKRVHEKLQLLTKRYDILLKENDLLKEQMKSHKHREVELLERASRLEQQVAILKKLAGTMEEADKRDFEKRLNHYLKEIDRCITMLSE